MVYKMIGGDGNEYGPYSEPQIRELVRQGRANGQTMVKNISVHTEFMPVQALPEFSDLFPGMRPAPQVASVRDFNLASLDSIAKVVEETVVGRDGPAAEDPSGTPPDINLIATFGTAWKLFMSKPAPAVMATVIAIVAGVLLGYTVPALGALIGPALMCLVMAGLSWMYLGLIERGQGDFPDVFAGWAQPAFLMAALIPAVPLMAGHFLLGFFGFNALTTLLTVALVIPGWIAATTLWLFSPLLTLEKRLPIQPALEGSRTHVTRNLLAYAVFVLVWAVLLVAGSLPMGLGTLVTVPTMAASVALLYRERISRRAVY